MKRANLSIKRAVLFLSLALLLCCLTGCAPMRGNGKSYSAALPEAAAERIALDAAARLALLYPPGHTALYLHRPEPEKPGAKPALFDRLFENHLQDCAGSRAGRPAGFMDGGCPGQCGADNGGKLVLAAVCR